MYDIKTAELWDSWIGISPSDATPELIRSIVEQKAPANDVNGLTEALCTYRLKELDS
jgi:hypothetical protein